MKNPRPDDHTSHWAAVLLLVLSWCALAKCAFGIAAYLRVLRLEHLGSFAVLLSLSASAAWMLRPALAWPQYAAVFALIGAAYSDGPIFRVGWGDAPNIEGFLAVAVWLIVLDRRWEANALRWLWCATGFAISVALVFLLTPRAPTSSLLEEPWTYWTAALLLALLVLALRLRSDQRLLTTELTFVLLGLAPMILLLVCLLLWPATGIVASPIPGVLANLWLAVVPLGLTLMYEYRRRHHVDKRSHLGRGDLPFQGR